MGTGSRIVEGGELSVDGKGLEAVVVDGITKPQGAVISPHAATDFGNYTLNERLIKFSPCFKKLKISP